VNGKMVTEMEKEFLHGKLEINTKENTKMVKDMDKEF